MKVKAINAEVRELAEKRGPSLLKALINIAEDSSVPTTLRIAAAKEALPFLLPRLEQIAVTGPNGDRLPDPTSVVIMTEIMGDAQARRMIENVFIDATQRARERARLLESAPPPADDL